MPILRLSLWLAVLAVIFIPLERLFAAHPQPVLRKGFGTDLCYYFLNSLFPVFVLSVPMGIVTWLVRLGIQSPHRAGGESALCSVALLHVVV
jgi:hypothetical protein